MSKEITIDLVCWTCRKKAPIVVDQPPQMAIHVAGWANDVGWVGSIDSHWKRTLVFCCDSCKERAKTKDGQRFKKYRPSHVVESVP